VSEQAKPLSLSLSNFQFEAARGAASRKKMREMDRELGRRKNVVRHVVHGRSNYRYENEVITLSPTARPLDGTRRVPVKKYRFQMDERAKQRRGRRNDLTKPHSWARDINQISFRRIQSPSDRRRTFKNARSRVCY